MRWDKNYSQPEVINDPVVIPAYGVTDVERAYWNAKQEALEYDRYPTLRSDKHCTSGVIHRALEDYKTSAVQLCQAFFWGQVNGLAQTKEACEGYATAASDSATAAAGYRDTAEDYKDSALASSNAAADSADDASNYAADALLSKTAAETAAGTAGANKVDAEAWAVGTRNGVPVDSLDPAYHNNSKYYADRGAEIIRDDEVGSHTTWSSSKLTTQLEGKADLVSGKVPASQLPSYVDDVIEGYYNSLDGRFYEESTYETEITPESGKLYSDLGNNKTYRWGGSAYARMDAGLVIGELAGTAYEGSKGKANADAISSIQELIPSTATANNKFATANDIPVVPTALASFTDDATHRLVTDTEKNSWNGKAEMSDIPVVPTALSAFTDDSTHRLVTDTEKSNWNGKAEVSDIPTTLSSFTDDSTHRLVTDTEKSAWNGKAETSDISTAISAAFNGVTFTKVNNTVYINW